MAGVLYGNTYGQVGDDQDLLRRIAEGKSRAATARAGGGPPPLSSTTSGLGNVTPITSKTKAPTKIGGMVRSTTRRIGALGPKIRGAVNSGVGKAGALGALATTAMDTAMTPTERYADRFGTQAGESLTKDLLLRGGGAASDLGNVLTLGQASRLYRDTGKTYPGERSLIDAQAAPAAPAVYPGIATGPTNARRAPALRPPAETRANVSRDLESGQGILVGESGKVASNIPGVKNTGRGTLSVVEPFRASTATDPTTRALTNAALVDDGGALQGALSDAIARGDYEGADLAVRSPEERAQYHETKARGALMKDITNRVRAGQKIGESRLALAQQLLGTPEPQSRALSDQKTQREVQGLDIGVASAQQLQDMITQYNSLTDEQDPTGAVRNNLLNAILAAQGKSSDGRYKGYETGGGPDQPKGVAVLDTQTGVLQGGALSSPNGMPADARQAPDGNWYVPDPNRPGKYLMVR